MAGRRLEGRCALVTGASSGIGEALARLLAGEGADLVITARRRDRLVALAGEINEQHGVDVQVEVLDLARPDAGALLFERIERAGAEIDLLVNNAGFGTYEDFAELPWERHAAMLQVNVIALTQLTRLFTPLMIERGRGYVMNVASVGAYLPTPTFAAYAASKAYVRNFTEALDYELGGTGVRAFVVCPGGTHTEFSQTARQKITKSGELVMMSAERCAQIALSKMLGGRRTVVTGFLNALSMWLLRFVPRGMMPWFAAKFLGAGAEKAELPALPSAEPDDEDD